MTEPKNSNFDLDDFLKDAAKVVNPIQATESIEGLMRYSEEEIKAMDEARDKAISLAEAERQAIEEVNKKLGNIKEPSVDAELMKRIDDTISDYGKEDDIEIIKLRMFCFMADFQEGLLKPLLDRSSKFFTQMEEVTPYQLARDSKIVFLLDDILKTLQRK